MPKDPVYGMIVDKETAIKRKINSNLFWAFMYKTVMIQSRQRHS